MRQSPQQLGGRGRLFSHPNQNHRDSRLSMCMARDFSRCLEQTTDSGASTAETLGSSLLTWTKPTGSGRSTSGNRCALLHHAPQYQCHSHSMLCCLACSPHGVVLSRPVLHPPNPITCAPCRHGHSQPAVASGTTHTAKLSTNDKKKHQITWLAAQAKDQQQALEQHWASGAAAKRAARQRYGFH